MPPPVLPLEPPSRRGGGYGIGTVWIANVMAWESSCGWSCTRRSPTAQATGST